MNSLADLPPDILRSIFATKAHSFLVIDLIKIGNAQLTRKLVSCVDILHYRRKRAFAVPFPKCISFFSNLRHLHVSIKYSKHLDSKDSIMRFLSLIPSAKLEILEIYGPLFDPDLFLLCDFEPSQIAAQSAPIPLNFPFKTLTTLMGNFDHWSVERYQLLPPTLTKLGNMTDRFDNTSAHHTPVLASLPRGLLEWHVSIQIRCNNPSLECPLFWRDPPPSLHTIGMFLFDCDDMGNFASYLPRSLTNFSFDVYQFSDPVTFLSQLPSGIRDLSTFTIDLSSIIHLKPQWGPEWGEKISSLGLYDEDKCGDPQAIRTLFATIPASINYLTLWIDPKLLINAQLSTWPPNLTHLVIGRLMSDFAILRYLPRTLKSLQLRIGSEVDVSVGELFFPPSLTNLNLRTIGFQILTIEKELPKTLCKLRLIHTRPDKGTFIIRTPDLPPLRKFVTSGAVDFVDLRGQTLLVSPGASYSS